MGARMNTIPWGRWLSRAVLTLTALAAVVPVLWTFINSFKNRVDIVTSVPKFIFTPTLDNYLYVLGRESVVGGLINSVVIVGTSVLLGALLGLPAAYALARYPMRWAKDIEFFVLSIRFLPPVAVAIPLMVIWLELGLYDTRISLITTYTLMTLATTIWLAIPAFKAVPPEVEEAAVVDGYGPYAVFFRIALPISGKSLIGAIAFSFVLVWNEFLIALMLTTSDAKTLPIVASELSQLGRDVPWGILNASVILLSLPPLLMIGVLSGFLSAALKKKVEE
jgi:multiple sugar transport system permease protein